MRVVASTVLAMAVALTACGSDPAPESQPEEAAPAERAAQEAPKPTPLPTPDPVGDVMTLPDGHHPALLDPAQATETAPDSYKVKFETTKGDVVVQVNRDWAPKGADRFYNLVKIGFYDGAGFFRTVDGFMAQFGISAYPAVSEQWRQAKIDDDPVRESNTRGRITFATAGPNTRTTQLFINYVDSNRKLDGMGFAPFGEVVEGMEIVDSLHKTGEGAPRGPGPNQTKMQTRGGAYLKAKFPEADTITKATVLP